MNEQRTTDEATNPAKDESAPLEGTSNRPPLAPTTDPTNPHNQEANGEWVANSRASDNRNNEPGLTNRDRQQRTN